MLLDPAYDGLKEFPEEDELTAGAYPRWIDVASISDLLTGPMDGPVLGTLA